MSHPVADQTVETQLSDHTALWLRPYLGLAEERTVGLTKGAIAMPAPGPQGWRREDQWPPDDIAGETCLYFVAGDTTDLRAEPRQNLMWGTLAMSVTAAIGSVGAGTGFELGEIPRAYKLALVALFTQHATFGDGLTIRRVTRAYTRRGETSNGDAVGLAFVDFSIDYPVCELRPVFTRVPDEIDGDPQATDTPVIADNLNTTVEHI